MAIEDDSSPSESQHTRAAFSAPFQATGTSTFTAGTTSFPVIDHNHPLYLQPIDTPGLGIAHQTFCVYTPQQNGEVERKHKTILEMARSIRFQAVVPLKFWDECINTVVYLVNRIPFRTIHNKSPFEMLHLYPPSLNQRVLYAMQPVQRSMASLLLEPYQEQIFLFKHMRDIDTPLFLVLDLLSSSHSIPYDVVSSGDNNIIEHNSEPTNRHPLRRSGRIGRPPLWLQDYVTSSKNASCHCPLSSYVMYNNITPSYHHTLIVCSSTTEPKSFAEAVKDPKWIKAMQLEIEALEVNHT
ncbi:uncharacterized protein [Nicotiana sylvestris]|uniref:uncharacterized protein n=1 Tax=Nicotiana sylvestris TaxID=4096 RepID=UPI00388C6D6C